MPLIDELERLATLHADGVLTDDEFVVAKASTLAADRMGHTTTAEAVADRPRQPDPADRFTQIAELDRRSEPGHQALRTTRARLADTRARPTPAPESLAKAAAIGSFIVATILLATMPEWSTPERTIALAANVIGTLLTIGQFIRADIQQAEEGRDRSPQATRLAGPPDAGTALLSGDIDAVDRLHITGGDSNTAHDVP